MLLQKGVDAGDARPDHVIAAARALAKPGGGGPEHRDRQQRNQRQLHIHPQHHGDDRDNHHQIAQHVGNAGGKQFVQRVDVGCQPRHDAPDGIAIIVGDLLMLELRVKLAPQIEHHILADGVNEDPLQIGENKRKELDAGNRKTSTMSPSVLRGMMYQSMAY